LVLNVGYQFRRRTRRLWVLRREGRKMGRKYPFLFDSGVWESVVPKTVLL